MKPVSTTPPWPRFLCGLFLVAFSYSTQAQDLSGYTFFTEICSSRAALPGRNTREAYVSIENVLPYSPLPCTSEGNTLNLNKLNTNGKTVRAILTGPLVRETSTLYAIEKWTEQQFVGGALTPNFRVLAQGSWKSLFYNDAHCPETPLNEATLAFISVCPAKDLSILAPSRALWAENSQVILSADQRLLVNEAYQWVYRIDGGNWQALADQQPEVPISLAILNAAVGERIEVALRRCTGYSPSVDLWFLADLPALSSTQIETEALCADGLQKPFQLSFNRAFSTHLDERIDSVQLIGTNPDGHRQIVDQWIGPFDANQSTLEFAFSETLAAGTYDLLLFGSTDLGTDARHPSAPLEATLTISRPTAYHLSATAHPPLCMDSANGRFALSLNADAPQGHSFKAVLKGPDHSTKHHQLAVNQISWTLLNQAPGFYSLYLEDENGCRSQDTIIEVPESPLSLPDIVSTPCSGWAWRDSVYLAPADGALNLLAWASVPVDQVSWKDRNNQESLGLSATNLQEGIYHYTISYHNNQCLWQDQITVHRRSDTLDVRPQIIQPIRCHRAADGILRAQSLTSLIPETYQWTSKGQHLQSALELTSCTSSIYTLQASHGNLESSAQCFLPEPDSLGLEANVIHPACAGSTNGSIRVRSFGGTGNRKLFWTDNVSFLADRDQLKAGYYSVFVRDANNCQAFAGIRLNDPPALKEIRQETQTIGCEGGNKGKTQVFIEGGILPYRWTWDGLAGSSIMTDLEARLYTYTVSDFNGCELRGQVDLRAPDALRILFEAIEQPTYHCAVDGIAEPTENDGRISLIVGNGRPPYSYLWSNGATTPIISGLKPDRYEIQITDARGCKLQHHYVIEDRQPLSVRIVENHSIDCAGSATADLEAHAEGGSGAPYRFMWSHGIPIAHLSKVRAGTYTVSAYDQHCFSTATHTVAEPQPLQAHIEIRQGFCPNDTTARLIAQAQGGLPPYQFEWSTGTVGDTLRTPKNGTYTLTITDQNLCSTQASIRYQAISNLVVLAQGIDPTYEGIDYHQTPAPKLDGSIQIRAHGGTAPYRLALNDAPCAPSLTGLDSGSYRISVTDVKGCRADTCIVLYRIPNLEVSLLEEMPLRCADSAQGALRAHVKGGTPPYAYCWNYTWLLTDRIDHRPAGFYHLRVLDSRGRSSSDTFTLQAPEKLLVILDTLKPAVCEAANGSVHLQAKGGTAPYRWTWDGLPGKASMSGLRSGPHTYEVEDQKGCRFRGKLNVESSTNPQLQIDAIPPSYVGIDYHQEKIQPQNGTLTLAVVGGTAPFQYRLNNQACSNRIAQLDTGNYHLMVCDIHGCTADSLVKLQRPENLEVHLLIEQSISCHNQDKGILLARVRGGVPPYSFRWNYALSENQRLTNAKAGFYHVQVRDSLGRSSSDTISLSQPDALSLTLEHQDLSAWNANDGIITFKISGGQPPYRLNNKPSAPDSQWNFLPFGTYNIMVSDYRNCSTQDSVILQNPSLLELTAQIEQTEQILCAGRADAALKAIVAGGLPPYRYYWNTEETLPSIQHLEAGHYTLSVIDSLNHTVVCEIDVTEPDSLRLIFNLSHPLCHQQATGRIEALATGGNKPYAYRWNNGPYVANQQNLKAGTYTLHLQDATGCFIDDSARILEPEALNVDIQYSNPICYGDSTGTLLVTLSGGNRLQSIDLIRLSTDTKESNDFPQPKTNASTTHHWPTLRAGIYHLRVSDSNNCHLDSLIELRNPPTIATELGPDITLCAGQTLDLHLPNDSLAYYWKTPSGKESWGSDIRLEINGVYQLCVSNKQGCTWHDSLSVHLHNDTIKAAFWISSNVKIDEEVIAANMSQGLIDSIRWILPPKVQLLEWTPTYLHLRFSDTGYFVVGLEAFHARCIDRFETSVFVTNADNETHNQTSPNATTSSCHLWPNPCSQLLNAQIKLPLPSTGSWHVVEVASGKIYAAETFITKEAKQVLLKNLDVSYWPKGVYLFFLRTPSTRYSVKFLVE